MRRSGTGKLIRANNRRACDDGEGKLTRWGCSKYSAGTSRLIIEADNRNSKRCGQPSGQNSGTMNER
ncbi:hypothetical protein D7Z26_21660 [Cohnella endophytica]|uniref:Uncharacterized protein n=1 Tax=Cohnella endophytica TaxID=2419778 RepID=A0A494XLN1_9BACL|nr:hypothetical protein [Cohnella endophytica]RKP48964.1 hypothetical protein D7Z26_21660 [Cohnella endophytica]